jgi:hypothetical protein
MLSCPWAGSGTARVAAGCRTMWDVSNHGSDFGPVQVCRHHWLLLPGSGGLWAGQREHHLLLSSTAAVACSWLRLRQTPWFPGVECAVQFGNNGGKAQLTGTCAQQNGSDYASSGGVRVHDKLQRDGEVATPISNFFPRLVG